MTNDITLLSEDVPIQYTAFLNSKGRMLHDAFATRVCEDEYILDCASSSRKKLLSHLKIYKLRASVKIEDLSESHGVYTIFNPITSDMTPRTEPNASGMHALRDPRCGAIGLRGVVPKTTSGRAASA